MNKLLSSTLIFFMAITCRAQTNPNPSSTLDAFITNEMGLEYLPGLSAVIVKGGKIVWIESYGFADVDNSVPVNDTTVFLLASVSKLFTGTAAMQLAENGTINLDQDINDFLPWSFAVPSSPSAPVTFRQLMTHTGSVRDNNVVMDNYYSYPDPVITLPDVMERYFSVGGSDYNASANFVAGAPGSMHEYSNMGTALNGYLVELAGQMPFDQYCNASIFEPLCMHKTSWFFADFDSAHVARPYQHVNGSYVAYPHYGFADYPDGQLRSTAEDMANFMIAYLNGGNFNGSSLLSSTSINEMWTSQVPTLAPEQGLNWYQEELFYDGGSSMLWGHNGGEMGASTDLYVDPANDIGICVLTNGEGNALFICDELYNYALTLDPSTGYSPSCGAVGITESVQVSDRKLLKVVDFLGRETELKPNTPLIKWYSDGSTERVFIAE
ncbi:MAG: serine hydrolase domain-containing protein [Brumimicrobium sp.]|nr:serine hydrolase domain-containing protein [Brumimicrobium sp.]